MSVELQPIDIVHIVFLILESIALFVFIFFVNKYTRRFKDARDPYTIACFAFIIVAVAIKIITKVYSMFPFTERSQQNIANCAK